MEDFIHQYFDEIVATFVKVKKGLDESNSGIMLVTIWPEVVALSLFVMGMLARMRYLKLLHVEATVIGLDFPKTGDVEPVCEYTAADGKRVRAWFLLDFPSYATGFKTNAFVNMKDPAVVTTGRMHFASLFIALTLLAFAGVGGYESFRESASASEWAATTLKVIAMTEGVLIFLFVVMWPVDRLVKKVSDAQAAEKREAEVHRLEELSEVGNRKEIFEKSVKSRKLRARMALIFACLLLYGAVHSLYKYIATDSVTAQVIEYRIVERPQTKAVVIRAEWASQTGKKIPVEAEYPQYLAFRPVLKPGDPVRLHLDTAAAEAGEANPYCYVETGLAMEVLNTLSMVFMGLAGFSMGLCFGSPKQ